jgi:hypothetical protein
MYFESDPAVLDWFECALTHPTTHVRRQAVALLEYVDCAQHGRWLERAGTDPDPTVMTEALIVDVVTGPRRLEHLDLYESDMSAHVDGTGDMNWEWEYAMLVCDGFSIPGARTLAWVKEEDDAQAREIALLKCYTGKEAEARSATVIIVSKRLVTRYTRSPRSFVEAMMWHNGGRPRYAGP